MIENKILLSILIPTVVGREESSQGLQNTIWQQTYKLEGYEQVKSTGSLQIKKDIYTTYNSSTGVEIILYRDNKEITIGQKREELYQMAKGLFSWQIDDDDDIAPNAIQLILEAIRSNPEIPCITFKERCMMNGEYKSSNHSIKYDKWQDNFDEYDYVRCPFYKDVIRTDIAKSVPFPKIRYNEDEQWSMAIKPLLTDEIHIEEELYYYHYEPKETHNERYGIK